MLRELIDRFSYRYRSWKNETYGDRIGAGESPPELSPKDEPAWQMILRFIRVFANGLLPIWIIATIAARALPNHSGFIKVFALFLAVIWCVVGLFFIAGELLTNYSSKRDDNERI